MVLKDHSDNLHVNNQTQHVFAFVSASPLRERLQLNYEVSQSSFDFLHLTQHEKEILTQEGYTRLGSSSLLFCGERDS
eukprot:CAMPEP_0114363100 /NCGR_PEP_ID=MMETSP0101-20121206/26276_1 /TAXON_ID=38822 ORGANISM="Pteridomonas danica, Strain PT" /NCGR_SAMPLE_ID=MMETSP0101 /ASSEMBLY_ACC=CAM_ASM_000211 /LENGTH=77 /DNA_ID=CAMNT_0001509499 /DNA_START=242 /DNA_END=471 /DNA_ORIENTATION=-